MSTRKAEALLAYLAVTAGQAHPRDKLAAMLWSDRDETQARRSLTQSLYLIRKTLESGDASPLVMNGQNVALDASSIYADVREFERLVSTRSAESLVQGINLYTGMLLDGMNLAEPDFEDWVRHERSRHLDLARGALRDLLDLGIGAADTKTAITFARGLLRQDPVDEVVHAILMRLLHRSGDRAAALRQYQACADILQRELQVEPDAATRAVYEEIRRGSNAPDPPASASESMEPAAPVTATPAAPVSPPDAPPPRRFWLTVGIAATLVFVAGSGVIAWIAPWNPSARQTSVNSALPLPDVPSIAVLPFTNLSDDPQQEYFSDGLTDDLITDLSKVSGIFVISRHSTFTYKGRRVDVRRVAQELGVRYVLEGSVRRANGHIRINAQLIDGRTDGHVWAERFDGNMSNVFALQDTVNRKIVSALAVSMTADDHRRIVHTNMASPDAYDMLLRGIQRLERFNPADIVEARNLFKKAIALDAGYARAYANVGRTYAIEANMSWTDRRDRAIRMGMEYTDRAFAIDDNIAQIFLARSSLFISQHKYDEAVAAARRTLEIQPNNANGYAMQAFVLVNAGKPEKAIASVRQAKRLNPNATHIYLFIEGQADFLMGRYTEAIQHLEKAVQRNPAFDRAQFMLAAAYAQAGQTEKANWSLQEALALRPGRTLAEEQRNVLYKRPADIDRYIGGLRKAGLSE